MDEHYDVIVIGAGNAGLVAALRLAKNNKKVLILESNHVPGGFATSFKRGRFEFEVSLNALTDFGTKEKQGELYRLFSRLGIVDKLNFVPIREAYHVYDIVTKENYKMPFGMQEYIDQMEEYVPGSQSVMKKFFVLIEEVKDAMDYINQNKGKINKEILESKYVNFMKVSSNSLKKVLTALEMPKKAQEILTSYWAYFGSPASTLSFVSFASQFYSYITLGAQIPVKRSHEISAVLAEEILKNGGEIKYLSTVQNILFEEGKVAGVVLTNGRKYNASHILCNCSPTEVFGKMIPLEYTLKNALKLTNSRVLGARCFSIFLGLNQSASDIGLNDYRYFLYPSLDSDEAYEKMSSIKNKSSIVTVMNNANPTCSPKGTTILSFTSLFFGSVFSENVTEENYFSLKNKIAEEIIDTFEEVTGIQIRPYIEEIEIATPVTYAHFGHHPDGVVYGYKLTGMDNTLPRILNMKNEEFIPNIRFCGGFDVYGSGYTSAYLSGEEQGKLTLKDMEGE